MKDQMFENGKKVVKNLHKNGYEAYFVGGCVRDMIMGKDPKDIDVTTNALPKEVQTLFPKHVDTGLKHGTVTVMMNGEGFEVTTYRIDGKYEDGRHPTEVTYTASITEDLSRRDFTMNAIAYDPMEEAFLDPFGGKKDIQNGIIKAVGEPKARFMEDPLRVMRALRFSIKYGFMIEENTKMAMLDPEVLQKLSDCISKERITEEMRKILTCGNPVRDKFMEFQDVIKTILPEITPCIGRNQNNSWHRHDVYEHTLCVIDACKTDSFEIKMAALLHDVGKPASQVRGDDGFDHFYGHPLISREMSEEILEKDFRVSKKEKDRILDLVEYHDMEIRPELKNVRKRLNQFGEEFLRQWHVLKGADLSDHVCPPGKEAMRMDTMSRYQAYLPALDEVLTKESAFKISDLTINGKDVMDHLGIKPGPEVGKLLSQALNDCMEEKVSNDREELLTYLKTLYDSWQEEEMER